MGQEFEMATLAMFDGIVDAAATRRGVLPSCATAHPCAIYHCLQISRFASSKLITRKVLGSNDRFAVGPVICGIHELKMSYTKTC